MKILLFLVFLKTISSFLIVSKSIKESTILKNNNFTVLVTLTNAGSVPISEILFHDQTFNNGSAFKIISGKNYQKIPDLPVDSTYKTSFVVSPKVHGMIKVYPAVVKYSINGTMYTAFSTFKGIYVKSWNPMVSTFGRWLVFIVILFTALKINVWIKNSDKKKN